MKKLLVFCLALVMALSLAACSSKKQEDAWESDLDKVNEVVETLDEVTEDLAEKTEETATSSGVDWKEFIKEYEEWADKYIKVTKKYSDNPGDMGVLSEYSALLTEMTEWTDRADEISEELENASLDEQMEYVSELSRIANKIAQAAY